MKIYHNIPENKNLFKNPVVTIGNFDGVHIGHQKIFSRVLEIAKKKNADPIVITFSSHPRKVLNPELHIKILTTAAEKVNAIFGLGITNIILLHFTREMADMSAHDFYNDVLIKKLDIKDIVIGYDHAFGKNREGNMEYLKHLASETGIGITRVSEEKYRGQPVSSTWLRRELDAGHLDAVRQLLGRNYSLSGSIGKGEGRGRLLGFPTANILPEDADKIIPGDGVYAVVLTLEDEVRRLGVLNIGSNPTFNADTVTIEVHIFDFEGDIYNSEITVEFIERIRGEIKFNSADDLVKQMHKDKAEALKILKKL